MLNGFRKINNYRQTDMLKQCLCLEYNNFSQNMQFNHYFMHPIKVVGFQNKSFIIRKFNLLIDFQTAIRHFIKHAFFILSTCINHINGEIVNRYPNDLVMMLCLCCKSLSEIDISGRKKTSNHQMGILCQTQYKKT